jgi:hypothetical protein
MRDEPDAARIVLERRIVQALRSRQTANAVRRHTVGFMVSRRVTQWGRVCYLSLQTHLVQRETRRSPICARRVKNDRIS